MVAIRDYFACHSNEYWLAVWQHLTLSGQTLLLALLIALPLGQSAFFAGLCLAANSIIAIATIAATINAGGIGTILFDGLRTMSLPKLAWGIILTVFLSLLTNLIIYLIENLFKNNSDTLGAI